MLYRLLLYWLYNVRLQLFNFFNDHKYFGQRTQLSIIHNNNASVYCETCFRDIIIAVDQQNISKNLTANFFKGLTQNSGQINVRFCGNSLPILKISDENIEKWKSLKLFGEVNFAINANWDMGNFVHFLQFFGLSIHISTGISIELSAITFIEYIVQAYLAFHTKLVSFKYIDIWPIYEPKSIKFGVYAQIWANGFWLITQPIVVQYG